MSCTECKQNSCISDIIVQHCDKYGPNTCLNHLVCSDCLTKSLNKVILDNCIKCKKNKCCIICMNCSEEKIKPILTEKRKNINNLIKNGKIEF